MRFYEPHHFDGVDIVITAALLSLFGLRVHRLGWKLAAHEALDGLLVAVPLVGCAVAINAIRPFDWILYAQLAVFCAWWVIDDQLRAVVKKRARRRRVWARILRREREERAMAATASDWERP